jgi:hypothetical protein
VGRGRKAHHVEAGLGKAGLGAHELDAAAASLKEAVGGYPFPIFHLQFEPLSGLELLLYVGASLADDRIEGGLVESNVGGDCPLREHHQAREGRLRLRRHQDVNGCICKPVSTPRIHDGAERSSAAFQLRDRLLRSVDLGGRRAARAQHAAEGTCAHEPEKRPSIDAAIVLF